MVAQRINRVASAAILALRVTVCLAAGLGFASPPWRTWPSTND
jgi:hypothetical protein